MLSVQHLRKGFTTVLALEDVSFDVRRGEIFGLIGPNGAGKTTTIRIILNILSPDSGSVLYDDQPFSPQIQNRMGYLPEERGLYRKSRLLDTIVYFGELRGLKRSEAKARGMQWLKRLGLEAHAHRKVEELSKGNQQKVQFVCAVLSEPDLVILDEPFSGLDPLNQELFKGVLLELKESGKAVIFSTHQMESAEKLSDSLCLINRGKVVLAGSVRDVKRQYGTNSLAVDYEGDAGMLETLPMVKKAILYGNSAELQLEQGANHRELIGLINQRVDVHRIELREPSLQAIFLEVVGAPHDVRQEVVS